MCRNWIYSDLLCLETNFVLTTRHSGIHEIRPGFHLKSVFFLSRPSRMDVLGRMSTVIFPCAQAHVRVSARSVEGYNVVRDIREAETDDDEDERGQ